jgi:hypothetical protein
MLDFSFLINSCLDIFEIRQNNKSIDQDLGLLQAIDERLATYGWLTNTGVKLIIVVDMAGRPPPQEADKKRVAPIVGLRDADLKPVRNALLSATASAIMLLAALKLTIFLRSGFPSSADGVHTTSAKSVLQSGRSQSSRTRERAWH